MNKIEIPLSKSKILLTICGSIAFVVIGIYMISSRFDQQSRYNPVFLKGIGIAGILFFGAAGIYGIRKLFDKRVGLTIDDNGITDNTNAVSTGLIEWADITAITTQQVMSTKFLLIFTKDPNAILSKVSGVKRRLMSANMKMYGTPLSISSTSLKYNFSELEELLNNKLNEQRKGQLNS